MISDGKGLTARLLAYMLGDSRRPAKLQADYAKALDVAKERAKLPNQVSDVLGS